MKKYLTYDDFLGKYHPIKNHLDKNAGYDGCMFETFGKELEFVLKTHASPYPHIPNPTSERPPMVSYTQYTPLPHSHPRTPLS